MAERQVAATTGQLESLYLAPKAAGSGLRRLSEGTGWFKGLRLEGSLGCVGLVGLVTALAVTLGGASAAG